MYCFDIFRGQFKFKEDGVSLLGSICNQLKHGKSCKFILAQKSIIFKHW